mmetsp:Transcript_40470/g.88481  ORF Transcript_40470/g.88481 Transcript_40470/m.88481 type:complete len:340 (+) Transcript_40470:1011-2030(+)
MGRDLLRQALEGTGVRLGRLGSEQLQRLRCRASTAQLEEGHGGRRRHGVRGRLSTHPRGLAEDLHGSSHGLQLALADGRALSPLRGLQLAALLRAGQRGRVSLELRLLRGEAVLRLVQVSSHLPELLLLAGLGGSRGIIRGLASLLLQLVGIERVGLRLSGIQLFALKLGLELLQEFDHVVRLEGILLHMRCPVALCHDALARGRGLCGCWRGGLLQKLSQGAALLVSGQRSGEAESLPDAARHEGRGGSPGSSQSRNRLIHSRDGGRHVRLGGVEEIGSLRAALLGVGACLLELHELLVQACNLRLQLLTLLGLGRHQVCERVDPLLLLGDCSVQRAL